MQFGIRQLIFFAVLMAVPIASYFLVFRTQNAEIAKAREEIEHKRAMLDMLREATSKTDDLKRANDEIRASIEAIEHRLPTDKEMDNVLRQIDAIAGRNGLVVPRFRKGRDTMQAGPATEQPLDIRIQGDFDSFYAFLLELEQLPRVTRLPDLDVSRDSKNPGQIQADLVLSVYYQSGGPS